MERTRISRAGHGAVFDTGTVTLCSATLTEDGTTDPPLGPLYIAAALEEVGVEVDFRDFQLQEHAHGLSGLALARFLSGHARIVAISCFVDMLPAVIEATQLLHEDRPDTVFLLGGPGPTATARRILEEYPWVTAVVQGEGDETVQDWIRALRAGTRDPIPGMVHRAGPSIVAGPDRPRNRELDALPLPAYHLLDWTRYSSARIITTRGCAYRCSFCDVTALWGNRSVYRGLDAVVDEVELLRDRYGTPWIAIADDTFVLNRKRVRKFCQVLIDRGVKIAWGCFGRINLMTPELIDLMAEAGCKAIFYGIDSGSQPVLDRTAKKVKLEQVMPVLESSARRFDNIEASFIWGYPFETLEDFEGTLALAAQASALAPTVNVQLHMLSPLPLSPIYREFDGQLLEPDPADRQWLLLPGVLLDDRAASVRAIVRSHPDIYPGFFSFPTPGKERKRELLRSVTQAVDRTLASTLLDPAVADLLSADNRALEQRLLTADPDPCDRIGVGLALGFFKRTRFRRARFGGTRGPRMVRERQDHAPDPVAAA